MRAYSRGALSPALIEKTIPQVLNDTVSRNPEGVAVISCHQRRRLSYRDLAHESQLLAAGLLGLGIVPGDRVGMWASNCVEWVLLQIATARIGAVLVNVNPAYRTKELAYILRKSDMKVLFLRESDTRANYLEILNQARSDQDLPLRHAILLDHPSWSDLLRSDIEAPPADSTPETVVNIQYTSGTTGSPKGVLLSHRNLVNNALLTGYTLKITSKDSLCAPVPLYHCFGCVMSSLLCLVYGIPLVLPAATYDAEATLAAIQSERCTVLYGVPTMFIAELEHPNFKNYDLSSLRTGIMAGAPCPVEVMRRVVTEMHCPEIVIGYGQTESSPIITMSETDDDVERRVSTVGKVVPHTEVKLINPATNEAVEMGEPGELCTRGYLVMKGYDGDPEATARAIDSEQWLHTGDLAVMRPDGYLHITGRLKDMILRGGENIYPREIEEFLHCHPNIADVYVVGLPDEKLGETVLAWVKLKKDCAMTEEEVREYCRGKIAHFKVPQYIRFVEEFPLTVTGKVQKYRIREYEIAARGLGAVAAIKTA